MGSITDIEQKALEEACKKTNKVLKALGKLDELSSDKYDYTEEQIERIFKEIHSLLIETKGLFLRSALTIEVIQEIEGGCDDNREYGIKFSKTDSLIDLVSMLNLMGQSYERINNTIIAMYTDNCVTLYSEGGFYTLEDASRLFYFSSFTSIDMKGVDTSQTKYMDEMFCECNASVIDVSEFDTSNVDNMSGMFANCIASLDLRSFDTRRVKDMSSMFSGFEGKMIELSSFDTSHVQDMTMMFYGCEAEHLDLSHFKFCGVQDMFGKCRACITDNIKLNTNEFMKALAEVNMRF